MKDKLNVTIKIADQRPMSLSIDRADEEITRTAEYNVNWLWGQWREKFGITSEESLARVAFRFSEIVIRQEKISKDAYKILEDFEAELDEILLDVSRD